MKWFVFSVYDQASNVHDKPFVARSEGEAVRMFRDACKDENTVLGNHPEDFMLKELGMYDDNEGLLLPLEMSRKVVTGHGAIGPEESVGFLVAEEEDSNA